MKYSFVSAASAALLVLSLAGCKKQIDNVKVEDSIKAGLKAQVGSAPKSITCPKDIPAKAGTAFECKGQTGEGQDMVVTVTIKDDEGTVNWKVTSVAGQTAPTGEPAKDEHKAEPTKDEPAKDEPAKDEHKDEPKDEHKE